MKGLRIISAVIAAIILTSCTASRVGQKRQKFYIVEGYFFNKIPVEYNVIKATIGMKTHNGVLADGLVLIVPLAEEVKKQAISPKKVPDAEVLLENYQESVKHHARSLKGVEDMLKPGDDFPKFEAWDIKGKKWSNADAKGKVMVLNCWFTGCPPCRAEMPELSQWKNEMPDVMFFSSTYETAKTARPVLKQTGYNWIPLVNDTQFKEYIGSSGYPLTIVVDKAGKIAQIEYGTSPEKRDKLKQTIQSLR